MLNKGHYNIKVHWSHTVKSDKHLQIGNTFVLWMLHSEELSSNVCLQNGTMNGSLCLNIQGAGWIEPGSGKKQRERKWRKAGRMVSQVPSQGGLSAFSPLPSNPPQPVPPPSPISTLPLDFVLVSFIVAPIDPSPHYPSPLSLPTPFWLLLPCS